LAGGTISGYTVASGFSRRGLETQGKRLATPERMPQTTWRKRW